MQLALVITILAVSVSGAAKAFVATFVRYHRTPHRIHQSPSCNVDFGSSLLSKSVDDVDALGIEHKSKTFHDFESNSYESSLKALQVYYRAHGDLVIPRSFEVPAAEG